MDNGSILRGLHGRLPVARHREHVVLCVPDFRVEAIVQVLL